MLQHRGKETVGRSTNKRARELFRQGKYQEAERLFREVVQGREKTLGAEHADTLDSKHGLALSLHEQDKNQEAERPFREVLQGREKTLGAEHADTLDSKHWLALSLYKQDKDQEAERLFREAVQGREKTLGAEHADTLASKDGLALSLYEQDKNQEAERLFREAVQGREKMLGAEHADTLESKDGLVSSLFKQDKNQEAERLFREVVQGREKTLGAEHADTLDSKHLLALSLYKQDKNQEAERLFREAVQGREKTLGAEHADTLASKDILQKLQELRPNISPSHQTNGITQTIAERLSSFFEGRRTMTPYTDSEVYEASSLLKQSSPYWSKVPRIYIILRTIGHLDLLNEFLQLGFSDHWLPITEQALPRLLRPSARAEFVKAQGLVLTKSADLEKGEKGQHCYFKRGEPLPFEKKSVLGSGGFGQVDRICSLLSFKEYALKRVRRDSIFGGRQSEAVRQFVAEIETLKRLKHDHIVEFVGSYTDPKYVGLLMLPVAEKDLAAYLRDFDASKRGELRTFFGCLAKALEFLHNENVRHKDIKPTNILVDRGNVMFTDFGLSLDFTDASGSTTMGMVSAMSPKYCAPEVFLYEPRNRASDMWSLGLVFLEMVTVLKGEAVQYIDEFFRAHGSRQSFVRTNPAALIELIDELKGKGEPSDNRAAAWVSALLQVEQQLRPTAAELVSSIMAADGEMQQGAVYCGICCVSGDISSSGSDDGSEVGTWRTLETRV